MLTRCKEWPDAVSLKRFGAQVSEWGVEKGQKEKFEQAVMQC